MPPQANCTRPTLSANVVRERVVTDMEQVRDYARSENRTEVVASLEEMGAKE